jgi:hypothetical protein
MATSQQRLDDNIAEMSRKTADNFDGGSDQTFQIIKNLEDKLLGEQRIINQNLDTYLTTATKKVDSLKQSMSDIQKKSQLILLNKQLDTDVNIKSVTDLTYNEFRSIRQFMNAMTLQMERLNNKMENLIDEKNKKNPADSSSNDNKNDDPDMKYFIKPHNYRSE